MKQHRTFTEKQKKLLSGGAIAIFILLGAALALIWPQIAPEADNTNSIVIDMSDFDFGDEEMNRTVQEMVENDRKQKEQSGRSGAIFFGLGAAVCFVRAAMPWRKKERAETISDDSASITAALKDIHPEEYVSGLELDSLLKIICG